MVSPAVPPAKLDDPSTLAPSSKVTVPVGVPPEPMTVAERSMLSVPADGLGLDVRFVAVATWLTGPLAMPDVTNVAVPPASEPVPRSAPPSLNVTVPVGVDVPPATVAVNVTDCPELDGFTLDVNDVVVAGWVAVNRSV